MRSIFWIHRMAYLTALMLVLSGLPAIASVTGEKPSAPDKPWSAELHVKRYFRSHTSYEFGNPDPPRQAPLSRLEFPMNTWWAGGEFRRRFSRFSAGLEVLRSVSRESEGAFKDSDWTNNTRTDLKTIYSEAECRMEPSYMVRGDVDLKVADWIGLPVWLDPRPVVGIRWQRLEFMAHDGFQVYLYPDDENPLGAGKPPEPYPGDAIRFSQDYWQFFLGIRTDYDLGRHLKTSRRLKISGRLDWAYVSGENKDHHLQRRGTRLTFENTSGSAWHASLGFQAGLTENINVGVEAEYLRIQTEGSHQWIDDMERADQTWINGVKVWSEQMSLMIKLEYLF